jgi:tRNA/tmRNA/rRNA uracil-C5-methylase (TrmA/RlmC/RlmD family)
MSTIPERNYIKFDFDNIQLSETWDPKINDLKNLLVKYIHDNNYHIYNKIYHEDNMNFYSVTSKLTSLNEIYILILFVNETNDYTKYSEAYTPNKVGPIGHINVTYTPQASGGYNDNLQNLYKYIKENTEFSNISLWYQLTNSKAKPRDNENIFHINGPTDICENVMGYKIYISPNSFTQSNYNAMIKLYNIINNLTSINKTNVLHYYGRGMTPISHVLHNNFEKIYGYSSCKISYDDGIKTIDANKVDNIELIFDKTKEIFFKNIEKDEDSTIIISASRNGFKKLDKIKKFKKFIYIACNMESFLDEIKELPIKYDIIDEIDMFPGTKYKEIILNITLI